MTVRPRVLLVAGVLWMLVGVAVAVSGAIAWGSDGWGEDGEL